MFQASKTISGKMSIEKLWNYYQDVSEWPMWDTSLKNVVLQGTFSDGATGTMFFSDEHVPPLSFRFSEVEENKSFTTTASFARITVMFCHRIDTLEEETVLEHSVEVSGVNHDMVHGVGNMLAAQLEPSLENLKRLTSK